MKHLIVYDLDGTLVDTAEDITEAANHMMRRLSAAPLSRAEIRAMVGRGLHDLVQRCLKTDDERLIQHGAKLFGAYYAEHLDQHSRLYPGALEALTHFQSRPQAVFTNKPHPFAEDLLKRLEIDRYFVEVLTPLGGVKKPDPARLLALMDRLGIARQDTLFIGDSLIDLDTSRNAGIDILLVTHGFEDHDELKRAAPQAVVGDFQGVLEAVRRSGW